MKLATAVAFMAAAVLAVSGCGLGPGSQEGSVELLVTRDYGRQVLVDRSIDDLTEADTAMRVLDDSADLETRYGGGFVQSVDGLAGGTTGGRSFDWFFAVNGIMAERGSAEFTVKGGDQVWWDFRDWTDAMEIGAVVGAWPAPMATGYGDHHWPVRIECRVSMSACLMVRSQLEASGVEARIVPGLGGKQQTAAPTDAIRFLVGIWKEVKTDPAAARLDQGPGASGIFARFETGPGGDDLIGLNVKADDAENFGADAGLVAANRRGEGPPVWLITGGTETGVERAASALTAKDLERRFAAVVDDGQISSLPLP